MKNQITFFALCAFFLLVFGCTQSNVQGIPFSTIQFINQSTNLNYTDFINGNYDGNCLFIDNNQLSATSCGSDQNTITGINWTDINGFPSGCGANQAVQIIGSTLTCINVGTNYTDTNTLSVINSFDLNNSLSYLKNLPSSVLQDTNNISRLNNDSGYLTYTQNDANLNLKYSHPVLNRSIGYYTPILFNSSAFTAVGMTLPTIIGTAATAGTTINSTQIFIKYTTAATIATGAGQAGVYTLTFSNAQPRYSTIIRTDTLIDLNLDVGLTSADLNLHKMILPSVASSARYIAIRYSTNLDSNKLQCCSGDGTTQSCTSTNIVLAANTKYLIDLDYSTSGNLKCIINGITTNKATNLPTNSTTSLGINNRIVTNVAGARVFYIAKGSLEQN